MRGTAPLPVGAAVRTASQGLGSDLTRDRSLVVDAFFTLVQRIRKAVHTSSFISESDF